MRPLLAAFGLLTRLPVRRAFDPADVARATAYFPIVGAAVGGIQLLVLWASSLHRGLLAGSPEIGAPRIPSLAMAVCLAALGIWLTGAIHVDGLADMADGFGGGTSRDDVLVIMRDPRVGSYGAIAITLLLLLKVTCISAAIDRRAAVAPLLAAPILGRWSMVALGRWLPYARSSGGLGAVVTSQEAHRSLAIATPIAALMTFAVAGSQGLHFALATIGVTLATRRLCQRRLGGFTGDTLGANAELSEAAVWLVAAATLS